MTNRIDVSIPTAPGDGPPETAEARGRWIARDIYAAAAKRRDAGREPLFAVLSAGAYEDFRAAATASARRGGARVDELAGMLLTVWMPWESPLGVYRLPDGAPAHEGVRIICGDDPPGSIADLEGIAR